MFKSFDGDKIQPEIWSHIFQFLRRTPPPAYRCAEWSDLHQHELTIVSRVSSVSDDQIVLWSLVSCLGLTGSADIKKFHEIAIPHLYTNVVTEGLPILLTRLDDTLPSLRTKITSKRQRLAMTKHLRIAAIGPRPMATWTYRLLLENAKFWEKIGESMDDSAKRGATDAAREQKEIFRWATGEMQTIQPLVMPMLDYVVTGQSNGAIWAHVVPELSEEMQDRLFELRSHITYFMLSLKPKMICAHDDWGFYSPISVDNGGNDRLVAICRHYHRHTTLCGPFYSYGVQNRLYMDPRLNYDPVSTLDPEDYVGYKQLVNMAQELKFRSTQKNRDQQKTISDKLAQTSIDFYGFFTCMATVAALKQYPKASEKDKITQVQVLEQSLLLERQMLKPGRMLFDKIVTDKSLRSRIHFFEWAEVPHCEACGWTVKDDIGYDDVE